MDPVQRYNLANAPEVGIEASWAHIKDPKEKKRIQNRIAQRSYRQRMKARLEKLQAKVTYHEQMSLENSEKDNSLNRPHDHHTPTQDQPAPTALESLTPKSPEQQPLPQAPVMQSSFYDHNLEKADKPLYIQPQLIDGAQQLAQPRPMLPDQTEQSVKPSDKMTPEYIQMPKQHMVNKVPTPPLTELSPQEEHARMINRPQMFTPEVSDVLDFNHPFDMWSSDMLAHTRRQQYPHQQHQQAGLAGDLGSGGAPVLDSSMTDMSSVSPVPSAEQGLDDQFEYILGCTRAAGFESFDAMVTAYYNGNFDDASPLAIEQRLSRNRGLPSVVSDVFRSARGWSDWERRGFDEELLKSTESMLVSEGKDNRDSLDGVLNLLSAAPNSENPAAATNQAMLAMKKTMQNELPNLWALMLALSAERRDVWQRNRSNSVLAAILLLRCPGRIPNDQLLKLVSACL